MSFYLSKSGGLETHPPIFLSLLSHMGNQTQLQSCPKIETLTDLDLGFQWLPI